MPLAKALALVVLGALSAEAAGYAWHRWACHRGTFRRIAHDFLRRRHFDHHMHKYGRQAPRSEEYAESCEIAFKVLGVVLIALLAGAVLAGWVAPVSAALLLGGAVVYGVFGLGTLHTMYHLEDASVRRHRLFRNELVWRAFCWLRDFHAIHHVVNANFSILLPLLDLAGGTYVSPKELPRLRAENLFPGFDPALSSSCDQPVLRR